MIRFGEEDRPQGTTESPQPSFNNVPAWQACAAIDDSTRATPAIEFRNVKFSYGDRWILDDVSFQVMRGETLLVLSASGGGKSTILKLVMGLLKPNSGRILVEGEDITGHDENELNRVRRKIGMQFQNGALFDSLTVYDNVAFRCHEGDVPEETVGQEVRRLLRFVNLEEAIEKMPAELSGGMRIRVGIARALAGRPHIVLLDEPTAGLDPPTARAICELGVKMRDLRDVSSIFVTHGLENVRYLTSTYTCVDESGLLFHPETVQCIQPILTESIETEPPSNPSTGKLTSSPSPCCART